MWTADELDIFANPSLALSRAGGRGDVVQGLVPLQGITWLYGPSMSFKSFIAMGLAAAVSTGREWCGKATTSSAVVYIGAEGGDALHIRRAAAEMDAGEDGPLFVVQDRPAVDTVTGSYWLRGVLHGITQQPVQSRTEQLMRERAEAVARWEAAGNTGEMPRVPAERVAVPRVPALFEDDVTRAYADLEAARASEEWVEGDRVEDDLLRLGGRSGALLEASGKYYSTYAVGIRSVLCVIDTYSQTSGGDEKQNVSAYIGNLRSMIEDADREDFNLSFLVVDHATKGGGSYLGSVAKLNDVDSQIEASRVASGMKTRIQHRKTKDGRHCDDLVVDLVPYVFAGRRDAYGDPLQTLVVKQTRDSELTGRAAVVADLLVDMGGSATLDDLRAAYHALPENVSVSVDTRGKAFRRAVSRLVDWKYIKVDGETVGLVT